MEEEISLRELIEVVINGWKLIISITVLALVISGVFSYFILKPTYETKATVLVNSFQEDESGFLSPYISKVISPNVYSEQIQSSQLLKRVIEDLGIDEWSISGLKNNFSVEMEENSTLLTLSLKGGNPELLYKTLDAIISEANLIMGETIAARLTQIADEYQNQLEVEKGNLDAALEEYNIARAAEGLPTIVLLDTLTSGANQYILNIDDKYLEEIQSLDKAKQVEFQKLNNKVNTLTGLYNKYYSRYEQARSLSAIYNVEHNLTVVSEPDIPMNPIAPRKMLNMAIAAVIGLMASVGIVFFMHYWRESDKKEESTSTN